VGILGLGRIGKAIAARVSAMGMHVAYTGRTPQNVSYRFLPDVYALAAASDFLVVACPGGAATRNMVNADVLAALGEKGVVINIARGSIIDEPRSCRRSPMGRSRARVSTFSPTNRMSGRMMKMENVVFVAACGQRDA